MIAALISTEPLAQNLVYVDAFDTDKGMGLRRLAVSPLQVFNRRV